MATKCGFIALLGAPNAGKSTLLNRLVGSKVSIVSPKVQTTRSAITGIVTEGEAQLVFIDTPGIFAPNPKHRLEKAMVKSAWDQVGDADLAAILVDARRGLCPNTQIIIDGFKERNMKAILLLNKIDLINREDLLAKTAELHAQGIFTDVFMISALNGDGVIDITKYFIDHVPEGMWMFPEDQISTAPQRFIASEITREKLFLRLNEELPYSLAVETEAFEERKDGSIKIHQTIYVQREGHKKIILGKQGKIIKEVSIQARKDLEQMLDTTVHLFLFVKVRENWIQNPEMYSYMGLEMPK